MARTIRDEWTCRNAFTEPARRRLPDTRAGRFWLARRTASLFRLACAVFLLSLWPSVSAADEESSPAQEPAENRQSIGKVERISGEVEAISRYGVRRGLQINDLVFQGDEVSTFEHAEALLVFHDGSNMLLGSTTTITLDEMTYDYASEKGTMLLGIPVGKLLFVSGQIAKQERNVMAIRTPLGTIGIRGTKGYISVAPLRDEIVLLASEAETPRQSTMVVDSPSGSVILDEQNYGTVLRPGEAPTPPSAADLDEINAQYRLMDRPAQKNIAQPARRELTFTEAMWMILKQKLGF